MPTEIEIKMAMPTLETIDEIQHDEYLTRFVQDGFSTERQHNIYYDTPDWALYHEGFMLRIRDNGVQKIVSLKRGTVDKHERAGLCVRRNWICVSPEINVAIGSLINAGAPGILDELTRGKPLVESCHAIFNRTSAMLYLPEGLRVELAMDEGEMTVNGNVRTIFEMELEVLFGNVASLRPFCDGLTERHHLSPELTTKYEKAYALAHGEIV